MKRLSILLALLLAASAALAQTNYTPFGTVYHPYLYHTTVQPPINANGSSVWPAHRGVVPVKFTLSAQLGELELISSTENSVPYGGVEFDIPAGLTLKNMVALSYIGTGGGCGAGSPRFVLNYGGKYMSIYTGGETSPGDPNSGCESYVGGNLLSSNTATRFEATQLGNPTQYDTLPNILNLYGDWPIQGMWLVTDNGNSWVSLSSVNIQSTTYTFTAASAPTCDLSPWAYLLVYQTAGNYTGPIDEATYNDRPDTGGEMRIADCQYVYNLSTKNMGAGHYSVVVKLAGAVLDSGATFALK